MAHKRVFPTAISHGGPQAFFKQDIPLSKSASYGLYLNLRGGSSRRAELLKPDIFLLDFIQVVTTNMSSLSSR